MSLGGRQAFVEALGRILDRRRDREADVRPARIVGRNSDGSAQLLRLDGECVSRGGQGGYPGEIVTELPSLRDRRGTAGVAGVTRRTETATIWVERLVPREIPAGSAGLEVDVVGAGFVAGMGFTFYRPGEAEPNSDIEVRSSTHIDTTTYRLLLYVEPSAVLFHGGALGWDVDARAEPRHQKANAYDLVSGSTTRFWGLWDSGSGLVATRHRGGSWVETRGQTSGSYGEGVGSAVLIHEDAGERVGIASYVWCPSATSVSIWDVEGDSLVTVTLQSGYSLAGGASYADGWIYWLERETARRGSGPWLFNHRLCRCHCDGTDHLDEPGYQVLATEEVSTSEPHSAFAGSFGALALSTTRILGKYGVTDGVETGGSISFGWDLDGTDYDDDLGSPYGPPLGIWVAEDGTHALGGYDQAPKRVEVTFDALPADLWEPDETLELAHLDNVGFGPARSTVAANGVDAAGVSILVFAAVDGTRGERILPEPPPEAPTATAAVFTPEED